ncbi:hypothetical protein CIB48_g5891 [Xylaria polymorpha]|nr:hypothetical protein CIB48_g5891 [Xylaria polymorpha]
METNKASFGVELEFLVCVASADQELNVPNMFENSTGAPILLPPGVPNRGFNAVEIARQRAERTMANAVAERRGTRVIQSMEEALSDPDSIHLQNFSEWSFESDPSVYLTADLRDEQYINEYYWVSVEIASPAFWDTPESWAEIREVVDAFKAEYWIITPHTAGMHYHYGHGKDYIPFTKIRRMAALLVAVDPLIVQLHPTHRRANEYCLSNRLYSRIAHGSPAAVNARAIGAEYVEGEPEFPGSRPQPNPVARPFRRRTPNLLVPFRRGQLDGYAFDELFVQFFTGSGYAYDNIDAANPRPLEIPLAVREILRCTNCPTVAELMRYADYLTDRPAYAFKAYTSDLYKRVLTEGDGQVSPIFQHKRTVEFRQMASTINSDEVVAHGKIILRLCQAAAEMELEELYEVVLDCSVAEANGDWFDVFDLLAELGLESEAKVLQYAVARFRGETVPDEIEDDKEEAEAAERRAEGRPSRFRWLSRRSG